MQHMWGTRNFTLPRPTTSSGPSSTARPCAITQYARPLEDLPEAQDGARPVRAGPLDDSEHHAQSRACGSTTTTPTSRRMEHPGAAVRAGRKTTTETPDTPSWKNISPRAGIAWDLFANGKTVLRANYGHYVASESIATTTANNPVNTRINSATRTWTRHQRRTSFPDCDLTQTGVNRRVRRAQRAARRPQHRHHVGPERPARLERAARRRRDAGRPAASAARAADDWTCSGRDTGSAISSRPNIGRRRRGTTTASASRPRRIPDCLTAAANRSAASWISSRPYFGRTPDNFVTAAEELRRRDRRVQRHRHFVHGAASRTAASRPAASAPAASAPISAT